MGIVAGDSWGGIRRGFFLPLHGLLGIRFAKGFKANGWKARW